MLTPIGVTASQYNSAVKADAMTHLRLTFTEQNVVFTDEDFEQQGVRLSSVLNGEIDLTMGRAVMSEMVAYIYVSSKTQTLVWEKECKLEVGMEVNGSTIWTTMGYFLGEKPEKLNAADIIEFIAYDRMQKFDVLADAWLNSLTIDADHPMTVAQMLMSLCMYVGVQNFAGDELPNIMARSYTAPPITTTGLLCRDILALMAEAAGCYAKIDTNGNVRFVWFTDHTDYVLTGDDEFNVNSSGLNFSTESKTWEDLEAYTWEELENLTWSDIEYYQKQLQIKILSVKQTEDDIGVIVPPGSDPNSGLNTYMIVDNPFLVTADGTEEATYIGPIYNRLKNLGGYLPMTVEAVGNPLVETGDIITAHVKGEYVAMPIFSRTLQISSGCRDMYEATGRINRERVSASNREKLSQGGRYHKYRNDINELYSELYDPTTGDISILQQTASALGLTAAGIDITGSKYLNLTGGTMTITGATVTITSGSTFVIDSPLFEVNSDEKFIRMSYLPGYYQYSSHTYMTYSGLKYGSVYYYPPDDPETDVITPLFCVGSIPSGTYTIDGITYPSCYGINGGNYSSTGTYIEFTLGNNEGIELAHTSDNGVLRLSTTSGYLDIDGVRTLLCENLGQASWGVISNAYITTLHATNIGEYALASRVTNLYVLYSWFYQIGANDDYVNTAYITNIWGTVRGSSSKEVKHDIKPLPSEGEVIDKLNPVSFIYNDDEEGKTRFGLIHEEAVNVLPEICYEKDGHKSICYTDLIPVLLKEIQDLRKRVADLERR